MSSGYSSNVIYGNLFKGNSSEQHGGAIKETYYANSKVINNTIIDNEAGYGGGGIHTGYYAGTLTIKNNIIMNNTDSTSLSGNLFLYFGDGRNVDITNNIIQGGYDSIYIYDSDFVGIYENNLNEDPMFVDPDNDDYSLMCGSPCINTGVNTPNMPPFDLYGEQRLLGSNVDMGI